MAQPFKQLLGGSIPALNQAYSGVLTLRANLGTFSLELSGTIQMSEIEWELRTTLHNVGIKWLDLLVSFHKCDEPVAWQIIQNLTSLQAWEPMRTVPE